MYIHTSNDYPAAKARQARIARQAEQHQQAAFFKATPVRKQTGRADTARRHHPSPATSLRPRPATA